MCWLLVSSRSLLLQGLRRDRMLHGRAVYEFKMDNHLFRSNGNYCSWDLLRSRARDQQHVIALGKVVGALLVTFHGLVYHCRHCLLPLAIFPECLDEHLMTCVLRRDNHDIYGCAGWLPSSKGSLKANRRGSSGALLGDATNEP